MGMSIWCSAFGLTTHETKWVDGAHNSQLTGADANCEIKQSVSQTVSQVSAEWLYQWV